MCENISGAAAACIAVPCASAPAAAASACAPTAAARIQAASAPAILIAAAAGPRRALRGGAGRARARRAPAAVPERRRRWEAREQAVGRRPVALGGRLVQRRLAVGVLRAAVGARVEAGGRPRSWHVFCGVVGCVSKRGGGF